MEQRKRNANSPHKRNSNSNHASHRFRWTMTLAGQAHITESCRPIGKNRFVTTGNPRNPTGYSLDHAHRSAYLTTRRVDISWHRNHRARHLLHGKWNSNISSLLNVYRYVHDLITSTRMPVTISKSVAKLALV